MTKLDKTLDFGASFDWVTPLVDLCKDIGNGPSLNLNIDRYAGWSANRIRRLLKRHGIETWGLSYTDELIILTVKEPQAQLARDLLKENNISTS